MANWLSRSVTADAIAARSQRGLGVRTTRQKIGPVAAFKIAIPVKRLPKTRSGKILRATIQKMADGVDFKVPATIDDPAILDEIREAMAAKGIGV